MKETEFAARLARQRAIETGQQEYEGGSGREYALLNLPRIAPVAVPQNPGTSAQPAVLRSPSRLDAEVRSTCSNESSSGVRAQAKSSTQPGCNTRFRPAGTTTCCVPSNTSARSGMCRTRG